MNTLKLLLVMGGLVMSTGISAGNRFVDIRRKFDNKDGINWLVTGVRKTQKCLCARGIICVDLDVERTRIPWLLMTTATAPHTTVFDFKSDENSKRATELIFRFVHGNTLINYRNQIDLRGAGPLLLAIGVAAYKYRKEIATACRKLVGSSQKVNGGSQKTNDNNSKIRDKA